MRLFDKNDRLADIIHENYHLLPIFNRFDIRLGFGDKTIEKICNNYGIDLNFFLIIINTFHNEDYFPENELMEFSPNLIIEYLLKTHQYYNDYIFPEIDKKLLKITSGIDAGNPDINLINRFYHGYKYELIAHIKEEEEIVFPAINQLYNDFLEKKEHGSPINLSLINSNFQKIHTDVDDKLLDLKNIVIKYLIPNYDDNDCNEFLYAIFEFEKDLKNHARIEDMILIPRAIAIENSLK